MPATAKRNRAVSISRYIFPSDPSATASKKFPLNRLRFPRVRKSLPFYDFHRPNHAWGKGGRNGKNAASGQQCERRMQRRVRLGDGKRTRRKRANWSRSSAVSCNIFRKLRMIPSRANAGRVTFRIVSGRTIRTTNRPLLSLSLSLSLLLALCHRVTPRISQIPTNR